MHDIAEQCELVIALVAAVGTDVGMVSDEVSIELAEYGYEVHPLRLSQYLAEEARRNFASMKLDEGMWAAMTAGDELRASWERSDALALHAISDIFATRISLTQSRPGHNGVGVPEPLGRHAFVLRSLKTPDELETLRSVYGRRLVVIAAYSPKERRVEQLATQIASSRRSGDRSTWAHRPEELIARDEKENMVRGQDVSDTFHRADFFIRGWDRNVVRSDLHRILEILFGSPFRTPTRDEHGQFLASGAGLRSAEFGRQVGAAIVTAEGSIVAVGSNEVPKAGGGAHWEEDGSGNRTFEAGDVDTNRSHLDALADRLCDRVDTRLGEIAADVGLETEAFGEFKSRLRTTLAEDLRAAGLKDLTEFGRAMHAEMHALLDAALRGVPVSGATLHTTTFPCHNCARHIIGAGIKRVVFIEPYTKSRAEQLHADSASVDQTAAQNGSVQFVPFVGVAPRRYQELFDAASRERLGHLPRMNGEGRRVAFDKRTARPVIADAGLPEFRLRPCEYQLKELLALEHFSRCASQRRPSDEDAKLNDLDEGAGRHGRRTGT